MKKFIGLFAIALSLVSCSTDYQTPQERYADLYRNGSNEIDDVTFEVNTTYKDFEVKIYDLNGTEPVLIFESNKSFKTDLKLKYKGKYEFDFKQNEALENPYTNIFIYNKTTKTVYDDYEREGCLLGYNFKMIIF